MFRAQSLRGVEDATEREIERRIVGRSAAMQRVRERVRALARLRVPVLIRGDVGVGHTHVARTLQAATAPEVALWVVSADGGARAAAAAAKKIVLLEELGAFAPPEQARWCELLRRSEEGLSEAPRRILASTSTDLSRQVRAGAFDPALLERIGRFTLDLPALRDRAEDIPDLVRALGDRTAGSLGRNRVDWTRDALRLLAAQSWPGNVRELAITVERLVAFDTEGRIGRARVAALLDEVPVGVASSRRSALQRQREELARAIEEAGGNLAEVARRLEMSRGGVIYRAQKFGLLPKRAG